MSDVTRVDPRGWRTPRPASPIVELWELLADGSPGRFVGFGTSVGLRLVVAHPSTTMTLERLCPPPPAPHRAPVLGGSATNDAVVLDRLVLDGAVGLTPMSPSAPAASGPQAATAATAATATAAAGLPVAAMADRPRIRCRAVAPGGAEGAARVVDGTLHAAFVPAPRGPYAVQLPGTLDASSAPLPLPPAGSPVDLDAVNAFLAAQALTAPPAPASPPPATTTTPNPGGWIPNFSPPWCALFPGCWGCD